MITVSHHGRKRMRERCGKSMDRLAEIAFERGLTHADTSGSLKKYMDYLYFHNCTANNIRLYGGKVFIFCNEILVTVFDIPPKYKHIAYKLLERRELRGTADKG